ncbi:MAG: ATP-dependent helicase [Oscillospiraceae bacterium]|nr:ATP-dependent helicase [Oscillospiraceae bacterium]
MIDIAAHLRDNHGIDLSDQQKEAILCDKKRLLLLAVPGSGKTTVIAARIASLINMGVPADSILTVTFGRETARDMAARFDSLFHGMFDPVPRFSTIHSFCYRMLREYCSEHGVAMPIVISGTDELSDDQEDLLNNYIDYDDMLLETIEIFTKNPEFLEERRRRYSYINVDEAQDVSLAQHKIIDTLAANSRLFMVGDQDQSIYSFRGVPALKPDRDVIKIEQNFRSAGEIVKTANNLIKSNKYRYNKNMFCDNNIPGSVKAERPLDVTEQYQSIIEFIKSIPPSETMAVLYRNNQSAVPLLHLLKKSGIDFYIKENECAFFTSSVVLDIISYLKLSENPANFAAIRRISDKLGLTRQMIDAIGEHGGGIAAISKIEKLSSFTKMRMEILSGQIDRLKYRSPLGAVKYIEKRFDYREDDDSNIQKLGILKTLAKDCGSIGDFLDAVDSICTEMSSARNPIGSAVTLSTVHSAKGLEYDHVAVIDFYDGIFPCQNAIDELEYGNLCPMEEETRVFYVALTRARKSIRMIAPRYIWGHKAAPSRFIKTALKGIKDSAASSDFPGIPNNIIGKRITHSHYGRGVVTAIDSDDIVSAEFDMHGERTISLGHCLANGIARLM